MSSLLDRLSAIVGPSRPRWACEFTLRSVVVVGASPDRRHVAASSSVALESGALAPGVRAANVADRAALGDALRRALDQAGFTGSELVVVVPDEAVKVGLIEAESFPASEAERVSFVRWKLKKHVPFDVGTARIGYQKLAENGSVSILTVVSPEPVLRGYEELVDSLGIHPGVVCPSAPAALSLLDAGTGDQLFVKLGGGAVVTAILTGGRLRFYRNVPASSSLEESVYPTVMYYRDKLHGSGAEGRLREMVLVADGPYPGDTRSAADKLGLSVVPLYSSGLEDVYKPALGALQS